MLLSYVFGNLFQNAFWLWSFIKFVERDRFFLDENLLWEDMRFSHGSKLVHSIRLLLSSLDKRIYPERETEICSINES